MPGTNDVPQRSQLLRQLKRANQLAGPWVAAQIAIIVVIGWCIDWGQVVASPLISAIAVTVIVGPQMMSILRQYALQKKEIGDLKEQTRYGEFDKHRLRQLVDNTLVRLGLPLPGPPVYITADKSLNAGALHLGMGGFFRALNGVYLNRQVLHRLNPEELQDIVGHELGHFYRYYLLNQRFQGVTMVVGAFAGVLVAQWLGMSDALSMLALSISGSACWYVTGWLHARNIQAIEFLCDDFGAQVHGVVVSINGLLKIGADSELQIAIHQQELLNRKYSNLSAHDIVEAIESATPYGHTSRAELEQAVNDSLKQRSRDRQKLSLGAFLKFAWQGDGDDEVQQEMRKVQALRSLPRIDWEALLARDGRVALDEAKIEELVAMLEANPNHLLFHLPEEIGLGGGTHPALRQRILYLWNNREQLPNSRTTVRPAFAP
ncbi:MAG TPA: M48 family metalloprotease [Pirellulales bacterium]|nr:M48 family metalloprotease [Pirellulales bacterium]